MSETEQEFGPCPEELWPGFPLARTRSLSPEGSARRVGWRASLCTRRRHSPCAPWLLVPEACISDTEKICCALEVGFALKFLISFFHTDSIRKKDTVQIVPNEKEMLAEFTWHKCGRGCFVIAGNYLTWYLCVSVRSRCFSGLWTLHTRFQKVV